MSDSYWFDSNGQIQDHDYPRSGGFSRGEATALVVLAILIVCGFTAAAVALAL